MKWILIFLTVFATINCIAALQCYSCEGVDNNFCITNPTSARKVTCAYNEQCNILRTERNGPSGLSVSISRGCKQSAFAVATSGNGVGVSTSSQSCSTDLCNSGDGRGINNFNFNGFNNGFGGQNQGHNGAPTDQSPLWAPFLSILATVLGFNIYNMTSAQM